ncbi:MAG: tetratricopeptide repeat protein [Sphaerochaetaceae bacterium]|nr:tetratricopeptide repeat protein [Sphaerochaetaceae bacterium]
MTKRFSLDDIVFITLPASLATEYDGFTLDPAIPLPVQLPDGKQTIEPSEGIRVEMIAAGLIKVIAHDPTHEHFAYYRSVLTALQPDVVQELQVAAVAKANQQDLEFAEELFLAASHLNPHIPELFVNLSVLYGQRARSAMDSDNQDAYDEAIGLQVNVLRRALEHNPLSELLLAESGMLHLFLGNDEIALEQLSSYLRIAKEGEKRQLIEKHVRELSARLEQDRTLHEAFDEMQMNNEEQALRLIETFLATNKDAWSGWFIKGWAHRRLGDYGQAQEAFLRCLELGERNADIYNELSICALEMGEPELSKDYLEIALELDEQNVKLLSNLAFLNLREENYNRVHELLLKARAIDPEDPAVKHLARELAARSAELAGEDDVIDG